MKSYVTLLCSNDYVNGVVYLNDNLNRVGAKYPLACLVDENISIEAIKVLKLNGIEVIREPLIPIPEVIKERNAKRGMSVWNTIFQKLWIFSQTQYEKIVYLDSDIMVLQNIDELFDKPHMSCVRDSAAILEKEDWKGFTQINAGVMVIKPDIGVFVEMKRMIEKQAYMPLTNTIKDIYCDQRVIDDYYFGWIEMPHLHLDIKYNAFFSYLDEYKDFNIDEMKILHFAGGRDIKLFLPDYDRSHLLNFSDTMYKYASEYLAILDGLEHKLVPIKLSIIVPHYKEPGEVIEPLFQSLDMQKGVDLKEIEVIFCEDGGDFMPKSFFKQFKNLKVVKIESKENKGVALNRKQGLDNAKGKYITFIDCDDCLFSNLSLHAIVSAIKTNPGNDMYWGSFIAETIEDGVIKYIGKSDDVTHFHGKVYSKKFLEDNKITFYSNCNVNEDTYFQEIAIALAKKICKIPEPLVIWTYNENSLSRAKGGELEFTGHIDYINARVISLDFLYGKISLEQWQNRLAQYLCIFYFDAQKSSWTSFALNNREKMDKIDETLYQFYAYHRPDILKMNPKLLAYNYNQVRIRNYKGEYMEMESYYDFWGRLEEKHNSKKGIT